MKAKKRPGRLIVVWFAPECNMQHSDLQTTNVYKFVDKLPKDKDRIVIRQATVSEYQAWPDVQMSDHHFYSDKSNFKSAVLDGYLFLSETYKPETEEKLEDEIVILGGGPGARYGRGLCGIIEKLGLAMNTVEIHTWYHLFMLRTKHADEISKERKKREAFDVKISFLGLWDCTGNVGINPIVFPYELINPSVEHIRHAVAKDETCVLNLPLLYKSDPSKVSDIEEVTFRGDHRTIVYSTDHSLSDGPLCWMVSEFQKFFPWCVLELESTRSIGSTHTSDGVVSINLGSGNTVWRGPGGSLESRDEHCLVSSQYRASGYCSDSPEQDIGIDLGKHDGRQCFYEYLPLRMVVSEKGIPARTWVVNCGRKRNVGLLPFFADIQF